MPHRHRLRRRWRKRTGLEYPEQHASDSSDNSALLNLLNLNEDSADKRLGHRALVVKFWVFPISTVFFGGLFFLLIGRIVDSASIEIGFTSLFSFFSISDPLSARDMIWAVLEVLAGLFGITITVVAIIVQLSATRYTSRVVDLFLADRMNIFILFAYVMPLLYGFWLANTLQANLPAFWSVGIFTTLTTLVVLMVIPYFQYVFHFLQPQSIITTIERATEKHLIKGLDKDTTIRARHEVFQSIRQLSDITLSSIERSDIVLATQCINSLKHIMMFYLDRKGRMPQAWFYIEQEQIAGMSEEVWRDIVKIRAWLELEVFKQFEISFTSSLNKVRDINSIVARNLREVAERAATTDSEHTVEFFVKGFNTLIMFALNVHDIRSVVHVLYQYRLLAEALLYRPNLVQKICHHMRYYGVNSQRRGVPFVIDAVAYDLRTLVEMAYEQFPDTAKNILAVLLSLDQIAENKTDLQMLRGVRKSQVMMAAFFIRQKRYDLAKDILKDMAAESPQLMRWVHNDLVREGTRDFWEIEDRGVSFYFVEDDRKESIRLFFAWLNKTQPLPPEMQVLFENDTSNSQETDTRNADLESAMLHPFVLPKRGASIAQQPLGSVSMPLQNGATQKMPIQRPAPRLPAKAAQPQRLPLGAQRAPTKAAQPQRLPLGAQRAPTKAAQPQRTPLGAQRAPTKAAQPQRTPLGAQRAPTKAAQPQRTPLGAQRAPTKAAQPQRTPLGAQRAPTRAAQPQRTPLGAQRSPTRAAQPQRTPLLGAPKVPIKGAQPQRTPLGAQKAPTKAAQPQRTPLGAQKAPTRAAQPQRTPLGAQRAPTKAVQPQRTPLGAQRAPTRAAQPQRAPLGAQKAPTKAVQPQRAPLGAQKAPPVRLGEVRTQNAVNPTLLPKMKNGS